MSAPATMRAAGAPNWALAELLAGFAVLPFDSGVRVQGLTIDSRRTRPGDLFLACRGLASHGLVHVEEALERGASAIAAEPDADWGEAELGRLAGEFAVPVIPVANLGKRAAEIAARFFGHPEAGLEIFAVTGTAGKTCVSHYCAQALAADGGLRGLRCGVIGSLGNGFVDGSVPMSSAVTDPVGFQAELARLAEAGADAIALEASSHALDQRRVGAVRPSHALFTNLSRDHLDYHGDMAAYAAAKRRLFRLPGLRWAVLNDDDPVSESMAAVLADDVRLALYGLGEVSPERDCDLRVWGRHVRACSDGLELEVETKMADGGSESGLLAAGLIGRAQARNLLAVLALLLSRGETLQDALARLRSVRGLPGRMERFGGGDRPLVVVDHAHAPDALEQALAEVRSHCRGQLLVVFGCGGGRDAGKRPLMGEIAERLADVLILTDDNPRREHGEQIVEQILAGLARPDDAIVERQRALAIRAALARAGRDDAVLVAGKGDETIQDMGELRVRFSDRAQVVQALGEWEGRA